MKKRTYWCYKCNIPLLGSNCGICGEEGKNLATSEFFPIFKEELEFIYKKSSVKLIREFNDLFIWSSGHNYFKNGIKVAKLNFEGNNNINLKLIDNDSNTIEKETSLNDIVLKIYEANKKYLIELEQNSLDFIKEVANLYEDRYPIVSFSGGKDSSLVSYLVSKAFNRSDVLHTFADTKLEIPDTYKFIKYYNENFKKIPFITVSPTTNFFSLCNQIGPPSRIQRWCCSTQKTTPLSSILNIINTTQGVLVFDGIRKSESTRRSKYSQVTKSTKIANQILASPIFEWSTLEVWIYILSKKIKFNEAYKKGFRRVGCYPCPLNSRWSELLINYYFKKDIQEWFEVLKSYSNKIGRDDDDYIISGAWKARAGGRGISNTKNFEKFSCLNDDREHSFQLKIDWDNKYLEYLKPLGYLKVLYDDTVTQRIVIENKLKESLAIISINRLRKFININLLLNNKRKLFLQRFERQLKKMAYCIKCGSCMSRCPSNAIVINENYRIDEKKCINCLDCITKQSYGCLAVKSLVTTGKKG